MAGSIAGSSGWLGRTGFSGDGGVMGFLGDGGGTGASGALGGRSGLVAGGEDGCMDRFI